MSRNRVKYEKTAINDFLNQIMINSRFVKDDDGAYVYDHDLAHQDYEDLIQNDYLVDLDGEFGNGTNLSMTQETFSYILDYVHENQSEFQDILRVRGQGVSLNDIVGTIANREEEVAIYGTSGYEVIGYLKGKKPLPKREIIRKDVLKNLALSATGCNDEEILVLLNLQKTHNKLIFGVLEASFEDPDSEDFYQSFEDFCMELKQENVLDSLLDFPIGKLGELQKPYLDLLLKAAQDTSTDLDRDSYLTSGNFEKVLDRFILLGSKVHLTNLLSQNESLMNSLQYDRDAADEILRIMVDNKGALKQKLPNIDDIARGIIKKIDNPDMTKDFEREFFRVSKKSKYQGSGSVPSMMDDEARAKKEGDAEAKRADKEDRFNAEEQGELKAKSQVTKPQDSSQNNGLEVTENQTTKVIMSVGAGAIAALIAVVLGAAAPVVALACLATAGATYAGVTAAAMYSNNSQAKSDSTESKANDSLQDPSRNTGLDKGGPTNVERYAQRANDGQNQGRNP